MPVKFSPDAGKATDTVVIVIDFQNEFVRPRGKLHNDVSAIMEETGMLQKIPHVVRAARDIGALIIHSPVIMNTGEAFDDADYDPYSYGAMIGLFEEGSWNSEFAVEVKPEGSDIVLRNRKNFSAFQGTQLRDILESKGIQRLFIMGFLSNVCIEETTREASDLFPDMNIYVMVDGCAAKSKKDHYTATCTTLPLFANVITCAEAQDMLRMSSPSGAFVHGTEMDSLLPRRPSAQLTYRPRILALHGAQSNNSVTKLQLENLRITEEDYDIFYLNGSIEVDEAHSDLAGLINGPFYSWLEKDQSKLRNSLLRAVKDVVEAVEHFGPFDGIYGFSSGGVVAAMAANLSRDPLLLDALEEASKSTLRKSRLSLARASVYSKKRVSKLSKQSFSRKSTASRTSVRKSIRASFIGGHTVYADLKQPMFKFAVLACAATEINAIRTVAGFKTKIEPGSIPVSSFHLIAIEDDFKAQSEKIASLFATKHVMYMPGGHSVDRDVINDNELVGTLRTFARTLGIPIQKLKGLEYKEMSEVSAVHLLTESQVVLVKLKHELLPEGLYKDGATIRSLFAAQPADRPFLYNSRAENASDATTYGDCLAFINGGAGDLRFLGIQAGDVVAYAAPPGGSAIAALAFLSIGAQTAAAPLAPGTAEPDALDALDQFDAKHLILFDGVDCPGVEVAFEKFAKDGKAKIHRASPILGGRKPGIFKYYSVQIDVDLDKQPTLVNQEDETCLLLRTSGTTARPKGVPLSQGALVTNGAIIAKSMQLTENDVCYSVMPLFHIGGISASILCTLASGGAVSCDGEPYNPSRMVDALAKSNPQPTWYSSVPTIHNATVAFLKTVAASDQQYRSYGIDSNGVWSNGHSLRMIRSGAAALLGPDAVALSTAYGVPIYPTYSMSEQMPISQPPAGNTDTMTDKPGSVGVPVAASTAIVNRANLRPQPPGVEGEIAISGPTVLKKYLANPGADQKSYFFLSLPEDLSALPYFLTGDVGVIDGDGFLSLKGRAKELIKKGGEQVSPFEVEEPLLDHPWVQTPICFAVPSKLYGEEVGCALVLSLNAPGKDDPDLLRKVTAEMRAWMKEAKIAPIKWPTKWVVVKDEDLPKTKTKKFIRIGLSTHLGLDPKEEDNSEGTSKETTARIDWEVIGGFRFVLACYVMFMHIGSSESWGSFSNLRGWPWHVHVFFTLGGYSMASPMNPAIQKKFSYFMARIGGMYPMYIMALLFGLINLLVVCRPSTFRTNFHWDGQPDDLYLEDGSVAPLFCEGIPATPKSYWGSLFLTVFTYLFGLAVTPFWPITWWMGYYLWFSSMYYQCLACFPATYNYFFIKTRKNAGLILKILTTLMVINATIIAAAWFVWKDMEGYGHYNKDGTPATLDDYTNGVPQNVGVLSFYLFGPFWMLYFIIGVAAAFLYDAYRPAEKHTAHRWGWLADLITLLMIGKSVAMILQGYQQYGQIPEQDWFMRPEAANTFIDSVNANRLWDNLSGRLMAPLTTLWIFALSTGEGFSAMVLRSGFLARSLAPNAYNCFLFHQMVGQWYYAATRNGHMWNWWRYRKSQYWFSPQPCPVEWYEYFYVVLLVVGFSMLMNSLEPVVGGILSTIKGLFVEETEEEEDSGKLLREIIEGLTGIEPMMDYTLDECGLASIGLPVLVGLLNKNFSTKKRKLNIKASDLVDTKTIGDMADTIDAVKGLADDQGV